MTYEELLVENLRLRARIRELEQENARLKGYGSSLLCEPEPPQYGNGPMQPERNRDAEIQRRLDIFKGLFRGREDVFAKRFVSKTGKAGYQPVCRNRWSDGCVEHKYKCEGCPFREFLPLEESVIRRHLDKDATEKDVIGIYPILADNTVYFLCADFDDKNCEHGYQDDVLSYLRVCKEWGIPAYIERSRSGKGAHVWIFFDEPILAADARRLGFAIIGAAMESNVRLDMKSYDRFLPNQDFLPKGGFGNLIALPLQGLSRKSGNSVFVDESFESYQDQWSLLSSARKLPVSELKTILANNAYQIELTSSSETKPWETPKPDRISFEDFSSPIKLVRANGLYVPIKSVSGKVLRYLKGLASFQNPKYYELLNARKPLPGSRAESFSVR